MPSAHRRTALSGLFGSGLLALVARVAPDAAAKKRRKRKKRRKKKRNKPTSTSCGAGTKSCGTQCIPNDECCRCGNGQQCCDGACAELATDPNNCGACGNQCPSGQCINGVCGCTDNTQCPPGCDCTLREEGGQACFCLIVNQECFSDAECPLGSFCLNAQICSPLLCAE